MPQDRDFATLKRNQRTITSSATLHFHTKQPTSAKDKHPTSYVVHRHIFCTPILLQVRPERAETIVANIVKQLHPKDHDLMKKVNYWKHCSVLGDPPLASTACCKSLIVFRIIDLSGVKLHHHNSMHSVSLISPRQRKGKSIYTNHDAEPLSMKTIFHLFNEAVL